MRTTSTLVAVVTLVCIIAVGTVAAEFAGPRLDGTVTLRSGQTISGVILTAQLGIVDGAEIGSRLRDGGYIAVRVDGQEQRVTATEIAAINVEWAQTGTAEDPRWKIENLAVTTRAGETVAGSPAWLVHATSLIIQEEDGTQKKIYAFPMAGSNFSPDNLVSSIILDPTAAPAIEEPVTETPVVEEPVTETPVVEEPVVEQPVTDRPVLDDPVTEAPVTEEPVATITPIERPEETVAETPPVAETGITVTAEPTVEVVPEGSVFASGQPAVVTFEVINPETGNPMQVRFLIVPLPAE